MVHILKRKRLPEAFDLDRLAKTSEEDMWDRKSNEAIIDAMYIAFNDREREFTTGRYFGGIETPSPDFSFTERKYRAVTPVAAGREGHNRPRSAIPLPPKASLFDSDRIGSIAEERIMSHISIIKTHLQNREFLIRALEELGYRVVEGIIYPFKQIIEKTGQFSDRNPLFGSHRFSRE